MFKNKTLPSTFDDAFSFEETAYNLVKKIENTENIVNNAQETIDDAYNDLNSSYNEKIGEINNIANEVETNVTNVESNLNQTLQNTNVLTANYQRYPRTQYEIDNNIQPINYYYEFSNPFRYGLDIPGSVNSAKSIMQKIMSDQHYLSISYDGIYTNSIPINYTGGNTTIDVKSNPDFPLSFIITSSGSLSGKLVINVSGGADINNATSTAFPVTIEVHGGIVNLNGPNGFRIYNCYVTASECEIESFNSTVYIIRSTPNIYFNEVNNSYIYGTKAVFRTQIYNSTINLSEITIWNYSAKRWVSSRIKCDNIILSSGSSSNNITFINCLLEITNEYSKNDSAKYWYTGVDYYFNSYVIAPTKYLDYNLQATQIISSYVTCDNPPNLAPNTLVKWTRCKNRFVEGGDS